VGVTPPASAVALDGSTPILFLSDLHFGDGSTTDLFGRQDERLIAFLEEQRSQVGAIVFLGDILDLPQAWSVGRVRRAHGEVLRYLGDLARSARVIFLRGNHDWAVDYETSFPGSTCREAVLLGERALAWHGHQVDLVMNPGAADATVKTYLHALLERAAGCRLVPPLERYDSPANRLAMAGAVAWARLLVIRARWLRSLGQRGQAGALEERVRYLARAFQGDPADLFGATVRTVLGDRFNTVVCGHSHVPGVVGTPRGVYVNTGAWASGLRTYGLWTGSRMQVCEVDTGRELGDEEYRGIPAQTEPNDLFDCWARR